MESINKIVSSIKSSQEEILYTKSIKAINNEEIMDRFVRVEVNRLEKIVMSLPNKTGTDEGISSNILKTALPVIKEEFTRVINSSLIEGQCPEGWKTSTIIPIPKVANPKKLANIDQSTFYHCTKRY